MEGVFLVPFHRLSAEGVVLQNLVVTVNPSLIPAKTILFYLVWYCIHQLISLQGKVKYALNLLFCRWDFQLISMPDFNMSPKKLLLSSVLQRNIIGLPVVILYASRLSYWLSIMSCFTGICWYGVSMRCWDHGDGLFVLPCTDHKVIIPVEYKLSFFEFLISGCFLHHL